MYPSDMIQRELDRIELGYRVVFAFERLQRDLRWFQGLWR